MSKGCVTTYYEDGWWKNKVEETNRASNVHDTKAAAVWVAREMARDRRVEHLIRNIDGTIAERNTYSRLRGPRRGKG